jgi:hypothetical protein
VGVFSSLKAAYKQEADNLSFCFENTFTGKQLFLFRYRRARLSALKERNICSGWRGTGLWPVNMAKPLLKALIALHRTLLHEHHDFFLASQHPSTGPALRRLASKYAMPARMWRHGIHSFLELLRHRLPASLEYMVTFIYLAYSMMALLYQTVPNFKDKGRLESWQLRPRPIKAMKTSTGNIAQHQIIRCFLTLYEMSI